MTSDRYTITIWEKRKDTKSLKRTLTEEGITMVEVVNIITKVMSSESTVVKIEYTKFTAEVTE